MTNITFTVPALDCPDAIALAQFYADLTGLEVEPLGDVAPEDVGWIEVLDHGQRKIAFQKIPSYVAPTWPEGPVPQQLHLDFDVSNLDEGEAHALSVGATKAEYQPASTFFRVFLDPVGHPFCLCLRGSEEG
ncbi:MAG: VOC family protein [Acidimicrobiales bacterium]